MATTLLDIARMPAFVCVLLGGLLVAAAAIVAGLRVKVRSLSAALAKAQQLAAQNLERLDLALDGADEALWDWNVAQNRTYYSERWSRMLGFSPDEIGEAVEIWERLVHPGDLVAAMEKLRAHMEGQCESYQAEFRMKAKDGGWRWIRARGRVVARAADGSPWRVAGTHLDITANKQAEEALIWERNLLRTLIDNLPDLIYAKDLESRFLLINHAQTKTLRVTTHAEALGKTDFAFFPENMAVRFRADELRVLETGEPLVGREEQALDPHGNPIWLLTTKAPIRDAAGKVVGLVGMGRDITELRRAREVAQATTRAKSEFLANMSHEIRTPMNGVIGMTGLLLDTDLTPEQRECAETVRQSAEALLTVINDILDFSKIEAGKLQIESHAFDLRQMIEEVFEMLTPKEEGRDLDLILEYHADLPHHFIGDAGRVRQVMTNLVGNAVKFTPSGHVLVAVACEGRSPSVAHMRISVTDTGIGIPADKIGILFEQFSQVDGSATRNHGGTGLGLAISKQLIGLMGGSIVAESRLGEGSTFWFELPLPLDSQPQTDPAPTAELPGTRVLVVDDEDVNRRVLHEQITGWGMRNSSCAGGQQGLEALRAALLDGDPYEVAIIDHHMPGMDGATLAAMVKSDPALGDTVVVMLTSIGHSSELRNSAKCDAYLVKPVRQSQLLQTLTAAIAKKRGAHPYPPSTPAPRSARVVPIAANALNGRVIRVLIAEDNIVNQKVATRMLEKLGLRVDVAANGREVLELFAMLSYDLILMDCQMPEMDGYAAAREIRRREPADRHVPIVAMTADAMAAARERCLDSGMDEYIAKPVKLQDLSEILQTVLKKSLAGSEPLLDRS
jgi:PAS domain S-box-containing protein